MRLAVVNASHLGMNNGSMALVIGMNGGSSPDGIAAEWIEIELSANGHPARPRHIDGLAYEWPREVEAKILPLFENKATLLELPGINAVTRAVYAKAATALAKTVVDLRGRR